MEKSISLGKSKFIGREDELSNLKNILNETAAGNGSTVFIAGEAGVGKSRLADETIKIAEEEGFRVIEGWCLSDCLEPLLPFREAFREEDLHHLVSEKPPPKVISAYIINEKGLVISKAEREDFMVDEDIFAGMLKGVENFVEDSLARIKTEEEGLNTLAYGDYQIILQSIKGLSLATVIEGEKNEFLLEDMKKTLVDLDNEWDTLSTDTEEKDLIKQKTLKFIGSEEYDGDPGSEGPKVKKEKSFENVFLGLKRLSMENPILLFIDDLHWADSSSLSLLHYISKHAKENKLLVIGAFRPEDLVSKQNGEPHPLVSTMQDMNREGLLTKINLKRLDRRETIDMVKTSISEKNLDKNFLKNLYEESEGNPFFILEILKLLIDEGYIIEKEGSWKFAADFKDINLPSKIYDVVNRRINRISKKEKKVLECASVVGEKFQSKIIENILSLERFDLLRKLNEIEKKHNLIHSFEKMYEFDHSKIREVLYEDINDELKEDYHRKIAETYEHVYEKNIDKVVERIAHHYSKANDDRAGDYLIKAGEKAKRRFGVYEAVKFYHKSLSFIRDNEQLRRVKNGMEEALPAPFDMKDTLEDYVFSIGENEDRLKKDDFNDKIADIYGGFKDTFWIGDLLKGDES